jgi:hypothetical protein
MSVALPALVVFVLLLPGFVTRSRLKRAERLSLDYSPFGQVVTQAVLWSVVLHLGWLFLTDAFTGRTLRPDVLLELLGSDSSAQVRALDAVAADATPVARYFGTLLLFAYAAPAGVRWLIERYHLDRLGSPLSGALRFTGAPWYYLLSGADFPHDETPDLIYVSAIVSVAGQPILYTGVLDDYFLDPDGRLDRVILESVMRRPLARDKESAGRPGIDRFYPIDGDYFVLRYSEAITLNIEYIKLATEDPIATETA